MQLQSIQVNKEFKWPMKKEMNIMKFTIKPLCFHLVKTHVEAKHISIETVQYMTTHSIFI